MYIYHMKHGPCVSFGPCHVYPPILVLFAQPPFYTPQPHNIFTTLDIFLSRVLTVRGFVFVVLWNAHS